MALCPNCGKKSLVPIIKSKPYLIVKESVTINEIEQGIPFTLVGKNRYGHQENTTSYYLMKELGRVGLNMQVMSLTALWMHEPPKSKRTEDDKEFFSKCLNWSIANVIRAAHNKKIILLMGAEVTRIFIGYNISNVSGLVCKSDLLPNASVVIPAPNPDKIMVSPIGELRNALEVFKKQIQIHEQCMKEVK